MPATPKIARTPGRLIRMLTLLASLMLVPSISGAEVAEPETITGEVLVFDDAWLHIHPDGDAERFRRRSARDADDIRAVARWVVVADRGEWIELVVAPYGRWPVAYCMWGEGAVQYYGVRVHVRREGLAEATTRAVEIRYPDGTGVTLQPGVPLGPARASDGWRRVIVGGLTFHVDVPADAIGLSFESAPAPEAASIEPDDRLELAQGAVLTYSGDHRVDSLADPWHGGALRVFEPLGDEYLLHFADICFEGTFRTSAEFVYEPEQVFGNGGLGARGTGDDAVIIPNGTRMSWPDGTPAGVTSIDIRRTPDHFETIGDLMCETLTVGADDWGPAEERELRICADPAALVWTKP